MQDNINLVAISVQRKAVTLFLACCFCFSAPARAQGNQGQNGVYNSSTTIVPSPTFIDASQFVGNVTPNNFCAVLKFVLNPANGFLSGAVIDARALNSTNTNMTCSASPWTGITAPPSTILLPSGTITIPSTWVLPNNTRLIGAGDGITPPGPGTMIQAKMGFSSGSPMIQFGDSTCPVISGLPTCTGISVERLTLDGQAQSVNGIVNQSSQDFSTVNHVTLYRILGTGLSVSGMAYNSGPYSNITFDLGGTSGTSSTVCASLNLSGSTGGTRGSNSPMPLP